MAVEGEIGEKVRRKREARRRKIKRKCLSLQVQICVTEPHRCVLQLRSECAQHLLEIITVPYGVPRMYRPVMTVGSIPVEQWAEYLRADWQPWRSSPVVPVL